MTVKDNSAYRANVNKYGDAVVCQHPTLGFKYEIMYRYEEVSVATDTATTSSSDLILASTFVHGVFWRVTSGIGSAVSTMYIGTTADSDMISASTTTAKNATGHKWINSDFASNTALTIRNPQDSSFADTGKVLLVVWYSKGTAPTSNP